MKTSKVHFELFKKCFLEFQDEFGLNNYKTYFKHESIKDAFANIVIDHQGYVLTVAFATSWKDRELSNKEIRECALHESLHLLVGKLKWLGECRCVTESEIDDEDESLVVRLTSILRKVV